ncbi:MULTISPECIES: TolC family protein [Denitromonas]|uniref:TolC family protein n=2 Tax=Denitromonas TaxID=139331 RepID=A0A557R3J3_9RHOO|nr:MULTISPECIES: TolC family protein [Denitromonas]TVO59706.1 TolC family protein [Denitromonas halophila]TVO59971.1 TolC family protein [Denitromonas ohlonensis]TVO75063.1 TolC family protein [Denitromonas ohlonensis]TVT49074.1 MAG: TolC family protein [Denitromonas halophila]TVT69202.1 MAG: TolC family protein [Denitromonas halophila]
MYSKNRITWLPGALLALAATAACAQNVPAATPSTTLKQAFDAAWARQPEALAGDMRLEAGHARRSSADSWTAEPLSIELAGKTDQLDRNEGSREFEVGITVPLWLPGERAAAGSLAEAEISASTSRSLAAKLRTANAVRSAYWDWQRASIDAGLAGERLTNFRNLASDVARRVKAGELARADQHQADGALAGAEASLAEAESALAAAMLTVRAVTGGTALQLAPGNTSIEPEPSAGRESPLPDAEHPVVSELLDRSEVARRAATLASTQRRANPELTLATTRERGAFGDAWQQTVTLGVRIPFGSDSRNRASIAAASADAIEAEAQLTLERQRVLSDIDTARSRVKSARTQIAAAEHRSRLAGESRAFFQKAFRIGEVDLPTRLRIELDAAEADRQLASARIEFAAAISALRQAMGLLPE